MNNNGLGEWIETLKTGTTKEAAKCSFCSRLNYLASGSVLGLDATRGLCAHDGEELTIGEIQGGSVVADCDCGRLEAIGKMIWDEREIVLRYLTLRAENQLIDAQKVLGLAAHIQLRESGL